MGWYNWGSWQGFSDGKNYIDGNASTTTAMKADLKKSSQKNKIKLSIQHKLNHRLPSFKCRAQLN